MCYKNIIKDEFWIFLIECIGSYLIYILISNQHFLETILKLIKN